MATKPDPMLKGLDAQLRKLVAAHDDWWLAWASKLDAASKPAAPAFHYTNEAGFQGIMRSETLWLHSIFGMNDKTELTYGLGIAHDILLSKSALDGDDLVKVFCTPQLDRERLDKIKKRFDFYSVSFGVRDDPGQWCTYGDKGRGVAIGLEPRLFANIDKPEPAPEEQVYVAQVLYGPTKSKARHLEAIEHTLDRLEEARILGAIRTDKQGALFCQAMAARMNVAIVWNSITTKSEDWKAENELRMLAGNDLTDPQLKVHTREDGRRYVVIPMPMRTSGSIAEIMVGPTVDPGAEDSVRSFLRGLGMTDLPPITRSNAELKPCPAN